MNIINRRHLCDLLFLLVTILWCVANLNNWITNSEFWPITLSGHWSLWDVHPALLYKPIFHGSISWIHLISLDSDTHLLVARGFYTVMGAHIFALMYMYLRKRSGAFIALAIIFILMSMSTVFSSVGSIRSDFLAVYFSFLYLYYVDPQEIDPIKKNIIFGIWAILVFMITPKSIYIIVALALRFLIGSGAMNILRRISFISILVIVGISFYYLWNIYSGQQLVLHAIVSAYRHHVQALATNNYHSQILIFPMLKNDIVQLSGLIVFAIYVAVYRQLRWRNAVPALFLIGVCFLHSPKLPFFIANYLLLIVFLMFQDLTFEKNKIKERITSAILIMAFLVVGFRFDSSLYFYNNKVQLETIHELEKSLHANRLKIVDGIGLLPRYDNQLLIYLGPYDYDMNRHQYEILKRTMPDMIIYSNRFFQLEPEISQLIRSKYHAVGPGYWLRNDLRRALSLDKLLPAYEFTFLRPNHLRASKIEATPEQFNPFH